MKKLLTAVLALIMIVSCAACSGSGKKTDAAGTSNGQQGNGDPSAAGAVVGVKSDFYAPNAGSQAEKYWHVKEIQTVCEFDASGKCTVRDTVYYLKNASDYEAVKASLEGGGWAAVWSADHSSFSIDRGFKDYTTVEDAIEDIEDTFRGYTLVYANGSTKHVDPPTEERKVEIMKEVFGFTFDDVKTSFGAYTYSYTRQKNKVLVTYISGATADDINALAKAAFEVCKPLADEGKIYNYLGKYGSELTAAPETDNIFNSAKFNYFKDGKEISVEAEILQSEGYDNTLALLVAVIK